MVIAGQGTLALELLQQDAHIDQMCIRDSFGIGEELFAGGRQADVITMTGEQIHTKLIFQLTNTKADC